MFLSLSDVLVIRAEKGMGGERRDVPEVLSSLSHQRGQGTGLALLPVHSLCQGKLIWTKSADIRSPQDQVLKPYKKSEKPI